MKLVLLLASLILSGTLHAQMLKVGDQAPALNKITPDEYLLDLNKIDSELILLDFWAGWCKPCIKTIKSTLNPVYNKYDRSQFEIVGISYDKSTAKWLKAIERFDVPWKHIYDADDNALLKKYEVEVIPTYYLIDKTGKIVGAKILSTELEGFIDNYFKEKDL